MNLNLKCIYIHPYVVYSGISTKTYIETGWVQIILRFIFSVSIMQHDRVNACFVGQGTIHLSMDQWNKYWFAYLFFYCNNNQANNNKISLSLANCPINWSQLNVLCWASCDFTRWLHTPRLCTCTHVQIDIHSTWTWDTFHLNVRRWSFLSGLYNLGA